MSIECVIENYKTKKYLYTTGGFMSLESKHLIGTEKEIENNLFYLIFTRDKASSYHKMYCEWAAEVIKKFVGDAEESDIEIHTDEWFSREHEQVDEHFYKTEKELTDWRKNKSNTLTPEEFKEKLKDKEYREYIAKHMVQPRKCGGLYYHEGKGLLKFAKHFMPQEIATEKQDEWFAGHNHEVCEMLWAKLMRPIKND